MDTIAAIATGNATTAIGIVRLSGPEALAAVGKLFVPMGISGMQQAEDRKLYYGKLLTNAGELLDMCLCTVSHAPNSYTGEDTAELQCHGSPMVLRTALEELFKLGVRQAGPGEFTKRAFINGKMDLTASEAVIDLIDAETREAAVNAAGQLTGAVYKKAERVYRALSDISAHFHAVLDYPDEDIEEFVIEQYASELHAHTMSLKSLRSSFDRGRFLKAGIPTAIIGLPNAGKSSLLNLLLGYDRAIVTPVPGTTRDTIEEKVIIGKTALRIVDTAGIRSTEDVVEKIGVERSMQAVERAELVLLVVDAASGTLADVAPLVALAAQAKHAFIVLNKTDLPSAVSSLENTAGLPVLPLSTVTGEGLAEIERTIEDIFSGDAVPAGEILTNARHAEAISTAIEYMEAAETALSSGATADIVLTETEGAMNAIGVLTGKSVQADVTDRIFSRFCVGK